MALFTDGVLNTLAELQAYDNRVLDVASAEGLDVTAKSALAQEQIGTKLLLFLRRNAKRGPGSLSPNMTVDGIVNTAPLKRWHAYETLSLTYQDAYNNQLNDRYQGKWKQYIELSNAAADTLFSVGVGTVSIPTPKASAPDISIVPSSAAGRTYYACASWVNIRGEEGQSSDAVQVTTTNGAAAELSMAQAPKHVSAWNIYAGPAPELMTLQNTSPLSLNDIWTAPPTRFVAGRTPRTGQLPEHWITERRIIPRG
jgi:hypothetical protein